MKNILVAYASKYGATAEIAEKIGEVLRQSSLDVSVLSVEKVLSLVLPPPIDTIPLTENTLLWSDPEAQRNAKRMTISFIGGRFKGCVVGAKRFASSVRMRSYL